MREIGGVLRAFVYGGAATAGALVVIVTGVGLVATLARRAIRREWHDATTAVREGLGLYERCQEGHGLCSLPPLHPGWCEVKAESNENQ